MSPQVRSDEVLTREELRLKEDRERRKYWKRWGPYVAERQWGTVREDYSADGNAWDCKLDGTGLARLSGRANWRHGRLPSRTREVEGLQVGRGRHRRCIGHPHAAQR
ncbi:hypothetical protein VUR80DRAFT_1230 [Thermomyces stellatus]